MVTWEHIAALIACHPDNPTQAAAYWETLQGLSSDQVRGLQAGFSLSEVQSPWFSATHWQAGLLQGLSPKYLRGHTADWIQAQLHIDPTRPQPKPGLAPTAHSSHSLEHFLIQAALPSVPAKERFMNQPVPAPIPHKPKQKK